ncbi:hypothetical protein [Geothrix fuzhouensis]|uniref:hypothetical protein n=1 Tax=Geothrix fuzhouensis TaxID=2966451 RepID=UPI00214842C4|nr:hypothetical protein [Geothrix fuzhouensis]
MPSPRTLIRIIHFALNPWMLAPIAACLWGRWRGGYLYPDWMRLYTKVQVFDLAQGLVFTGMAMNHRNNQWLRHLTQPVVFAGMLGTLYLMAPPRTRNRKIVYGAYLFIGLVAAVFGAFLDGTTWRNSVFTSVMCLVYLIAVPQELKLLSESAEEVWLAAQPSFWVLSALLVYSSGTLIFNASSNYFLRSLPPRLVLIPWVVVGFIHAIHEAMLAKAFLCPKPASS